MHIRRISVAKYPYPFKQENYYPYPIRIRKNCGYPGFLLVPGTQLPQN